jgi:membrane-bound serine protease (ClpP class)
MVELITNPYVLPILLSFGLVGIALEFIIPGFGIPGIVGMISFVLYFTGLFMAGFAEWLHIILFIAGIVLLLVEVVVPAFGIVGGLGVIAICSSIVMSAYDIRTGLISLAIAVVITMFAIVLAIKFFGHRGVWNRFILRDQLNRESGYQATIEDLDILGKVGVALTPLRPAGTAEIEEKIVDVVSEGMFIEKGSSIVVVKVQGNRVVVSEKNKQKGS